MILAFAMKILPIAFLMMLSPAMASEVLGTTIKTHAGNLRNKANQDMATKAIPPHNEMVDRRVLKTNTDLGNVVKLDEELSIDALNQLQLEDQAFWERSLSMSHHLGDQEYKFVVCGAC